MAPVPPALLSGLLVLVLCYLVLVDFVKVRVFRRFALR